jgi:excisionase family DNA binding protein
MITRDTKYFTTLKLAERWHCGQETVRRKLRKKELKSLPIGRRRLIPESEILRYEAESMIGDPAVRQIQKSSSSTPKLDHAINGDEPADCATSETQINQRNTVSTNMDDK